ncbi:unnamed protein product [Cercospora beticola]|nr:unnamed protein product [Cercospora beticola]
MEAHSTTQNNANRYRLKFTNGLPPGTDTMNQVKDNPRLPRPPPEAKRTLPPLPPKSERKGKWINSYLNKLDPETEYDQIIRTHTFYRSTDFATALGYTAVFVWLTSTPAGAAAIHGGKVITPGHQRYYETQLFNLHWVKNGSSSNETKAYVETINKTHAAVWKRVPGAFSFAWEAQAAIVVKDAWPAWGERLTGHFRSEPSNGSIPFGINYPRLWHKIEDFVAWFQEFDWDEQRTDEDRIKGLETSDAFIHQFCELWFPRPLHFLGRAMVLTFLPPAIRRKQGLEDPNSVLEWLIRFAMRVMINTGDAQPDPMEAPIESFYHDLQRWNLSTIDRVEMVRRDKQSFHLRATGCLSTYDGDRASLVFSAGTQMIEDND